MIFRSFMPLAAFAATVAAAAPLAAPNQASAQELAPYLQCVPYAREVSGIAIYGDAYTWWGQAEGRYERGRTPRVGAVMHFPQTSRMRLGHVAAVSRVLGPRRVLLDHANWSPIDGRRGQIERDVLAMDVSPDNDWSEVRVWYAPLGDLGTTEWRISGFIYPDAAVSERRTVIARTETPAPRRVTPQRTQSSAAFTSAFANLDAPVRAAPRPEPRPSARPAPRRVESRPAPRADSRPATARRQVSDPIAAAIARYED